MREIGTVRPCFCCGFFLFTEWNIPVSSEFRSSFPRENKGNSVQIFGPSRVGLVLAYGPSSFPWTSSCVMTPGHSGMNTAHNSEKRLTRLNV